MWTNDQISNWGRIGRQPRYWNPCVLRADNEIVERHPAWLLRNSSGGFVWDHYANNHIIDHSYPQAQQRWIDVCMNATRSGAVDGPYTFKIQMQIPIYVCFHVVWVHCKAAPDLT